MNISLQEIPESIPNVEPLLSQSSISTFVDAVLLSVIMPLSVIPSPGPLCLIPTTRTSETPELVLNGHIDAPADVIVGFVPDP